MTAIPSTIDILFEEQLRKLSPTQFENLTFDLLLEKGLENLKWRSPGADGGRDIEGLFPERDFCGEITHQKWYVECKHYTNSVDWPTVFGKISFAQNHLADFLLLITSAKFSPTAINEVQTWNSHNKLKVRLWPINQLYAEVSTYPNILAKYSLAKFHDSYKLPFVFLLEQIASLLSAAEGNALFNNHISLSKEAKVAKEISWLAMVRLRQLENEGKILTQNITTNVELPNQYKIISSNNPLIDEPGLVAFLFIWEFVTKQAQAEIEISESICSFNTAVTAFSSDLVRKLDAIALWANFEYQLINGRIQIRQKQFPFA